MKRFILIALVLVLLFSGFASANNININEKTEVMEKPTPAPWTALFTYRTSSKGTFGEVVVLETTENKGYKVFGTNIYVQDQKPQIEKTFFSALYVNDEKPEKFIETIKTKKRLLVVTEEKIEKIIEMIRSDKRWIILDDYENQEESFKLLKTD